MDSLARRIAQRFLRAEMLTKPWIMAVRRGWLTLLKPTIHDWPDVFRAFDRLIEFVDNLEEQVRYVRLAPSMRGSAPEDAPNKTKAAFKKLRDVLSDNRSSAKHWFEVATKPEAFLHGSFHREDGEKMLDLYRSDFVASLNVHVKTKTNPAKGQWNRTRPGHITELLDDVLEILRAEAAKLEKAREQDPEETERQWGEGAFKEFDLYGMKVVVDDRTVNTSQIKQYIRLLDETYHRLKAKHLNRVWYGTVFIRCEKCGGENPYGAELGVGGDYPVGPDVVNVYQRPSRGVVELLAHELGHRYWFKKMTRNQRDKFESLVKVYKNPEGGPIPKGDIEDARKVIKERNDALYNIVDDFRYERDVEKFYPLFQRETTNKDVYNALLLFKPRLNEKLRAALDAYLDPKTDHGAYPDLWRHFDGLKEYIKSYEKRSDQDMAVGDWAREANGLIDEVEKAAERVVQLAEDLAKRDYDPDDTRPVPAVSDYGKSNISEAFAEAFSRYVTEQDMSRDQLESFRSVLSSSQVVERFLAAFV